jgi:RNA polymerase sigma-70 factor (ECF subfamily)
MTDASRREPVRETAGLDDLLARARGGDRQAESALFDKLHARILALAEKKVWDRDMARDVAQETLRTAFEKYREADLSCGLYPWLFTILHHKVGNYLKRRRVERAHLERLGAAAERPDPEGAEDIAAIDLLSSVESALRQLSPECRRIFALLLGGAGRRDIGAAFENEPMGTIDSRISRCRAKLLALLESAAGGASPS